VIRPDFDHELVERKIPSLPVVEAVNRTLPAGAPVLSTNLGRYYCKARFFSGWSERTGQRALTTRDPEEAVEVLREIGVRGLLFSDADQESAWCILLRPEHLDRYFTHVTSANGWHFYVWASKKSNGGADM
jgi:hypothetical protein